MSDENEISMSFGVKCGSALGLLSGLAFGFMGPVWLSFEMGKSAGEMIAWRKVPDGMRVCKSMLDAGPMNEIQEGYCAELLAKALGERD